MYGISRFCRRRSRWRSHPRMRRQYLMVSLGNNTVPNSTTSNIKPFRFQGSRLMYVNMNSTTNPSRGKNSGRNTLDKVRAPMSIYRTRERLLPMSAIFMFVCGISEYMFMLLSFVLSHTCYRDTQSDSIFCYRASCDIKSAFLKCGGKGIIG